MEKSPSTLFEQLTHRIHKLVEDESATVVWNESRSDPDNPKQSRQIDVMIERDGYKTLVECRSHKSKQDVTWIEELIGRRISLQADSIIGVSASGFTAGAVEKAKKHGVLLRDIHSLSEREVLSWGNTTKVITTFYELLNLKIALVFDSLIEGKIGIDMADFIEKNRELITLSLDVFCKNLDEKGPAENSFLAEADIDGSGITINDLKPRKVSLTAKINRIEREARLPYISIYRNPVIQPIEEVAFVEKSQDGEFEILQSEDNVAIMIDARGIKAPENCMFRSQRFLFDRTVLMKNMEFFGFELPKMPGFTLEISFV